MTEIEKQKSKLELLEEKKRQLENQIKTIRAREKQEKRKAHNHCLIEIGGMSLKYFNCLESAKADYANFPKEQYEEFLKALVSIPEVKELIKNKFSK